ncbi:MAG: hypothetical protein Q8K64_12875 [Sediminibacterium sp.]|nr:MAG: PAS domain-containing [Chitinophagaceae bacterium]MDP1844304.1 hypothetical protein [Sediminibacterium sp.]TXT33054.1 MAG: PAS domain-containing protein [Chitinophagaceae bacterium]
MKSINSNKRAASKRLFLFAIVALVIILGIGMVNHSRGLVVSATLLYCFAGVIAFIMYLDFLGYTRFINAAVVITVNVFLTLITLAEGLETGGFLFIIPTIFALVFMLGNTREYKLEVILYFIINVTTFALLVLLVPQKSNWQLISDAIYRTMFVTNTIAVVLLCAVFAYIGIYFERQVYARLVDERNKAKQQEEMIREQNAHLRDIAFMSSHTVRAPLSNILGLASLMNHTHDDLESNLFVINGIQSSAKELDMVIHGIVAKTGSLINK